MCVLVNLKFCICWPSFMFHFCLICWGIQVVGTGKSQPPKHKLSYFSGKVIPSVVHVYIDGLVQDCSNSIANALELLQSCTKPSICPWPHCNVKLIVYCICIYMYLVHMQRENETQLKRLKHFSFTCKLLATLFRYFWDRNCSSNDLMPLPGPKMVKFTKPVLSNLWYKMCLRR